MTSGPDKKTGKKIVKVDERVHEQIIDMAENLDIPPGALVEEAVVFYLVNTREQLLNRIQERLDAMFEKLDKTPYFTVLPPQMAAEER